MAAEAVLLTGATGFVGSSILRRLLVEGFQVCAVLRNTTKVDNVKRIAHEIGKAGDLSFAIVPDFVAPDAFDEVVRGVQCIIHSASPVPFKASPDDHEDWERSLISPAVQGTLGILRSANKVGNIRRMVITSSLAAMFPVSFLLGQTSDPIAADTRQADICPPFPNANVAYMASKTAALNAAERWIKTINPSFDIVHIHPSYIFGCDLSATTSAAYETSSNSLILAAAMGRLSPEMSALHAVFTDVEDTARIHVGALDSRTPGNQSFIVSSNGRDGGRWEDVPEIVAAHFPGSVKDGVFPEAPATFTTLPAVVDVGKVESLFGIHLATFEEVVKSALAHYTELLAKENTV